MRWKTQCICVMTSNHWFSNFNRKNKPVWATKCLEIHTRWRFIWIKSIIRWSRDWWIFFIFKIIFFFDALASFSIQLNFLWKVIGIVKTEAKRKCVKWQNLNQLSHHLILSKTNWIKHCGFFVKCKVVLGNSKRIKILMIDSNEIKKEKKMLCDMAPKSILGNEKKTDTRV